MISLKTTKSIFSFRSFSTISKKKILITGNDITGLSLALFLKKKGISSEIIESNNGNPKNDTGIILTHNSFNIFKDNCGENIANEILNNSCQINGIGYFSRKCESYGFLNFNDKFGDIQPSNSIVFSSNESTIKEILMKHATKINRGEGTIQFKKSLKIKKIFENNVDQQSQQQQQQDGAFVQFSNSHIKTHYDMIVGSSNCYEGQDPVRDYFVDKFEKSTDPDVVLFGKNASMLHYFSTVVNNNVDIVPPIIATQFQREKKLVSFILPNNKISLSGSFYKGQLKQSTAIGNKNYISGEFSVFEDLGAHNIVSLQDIQNDLTIRVLSQHKFKSYVHSSLCLIGDAADRLPQDNLFNQVIGIEDANNLVQILMDDTNENINIQEKLQSFNKDKINRMDRYIDILRNDKKQIFDYHFLLLLLGKLYLKIIYSSSNQYKRLKNLISK